MIINHDEAVKIEMLVRNMQNCERGGMAGLIDADNFESNPFDAAIILLAPIWKQIPNEILSGFINKWSILRDQNEVIDIDKYKKELFDIVDKYLK